MWFKHFPDALFMGDTDSENPQGGVSTHMLLTSVCDLKNSWKTAGANQFSISFSAN